MEDQIGRLALKHVVLRKLEEKLANEIASLKETRATIQDSANQETKSSAGDKYETGRAMAHLEAEKLTAAILEKEKALLHVKELTEHPMESCRPGALVWTTMGCVYISVSAGELCLDSGKVMCISPVSPLAVSLRGKRAGDPFTIMNNTHRVEFVV